MKTRLLFSSILFFLFITQACKPECAYEQNNICMVSRFNSTTITQEQLNKIDIAMRQRFSEYDKHIRQNGLVISFEPYLNDGLFGWYLIDQLEIFVRYKEPCQATQTTIHEILHLIDHLNNRSGEGNTYFFNLPGSLEWTMHKQLFNCEPDFRIK